MDTLTDPTGSPRMTAARHSNQDVKAWLCRLYDELFAHDGYGELKTEIRILRRGQKEVIIHCGKQYRFVVDFRPALSAASAVAERRTGGERRARSVATSPDRRVARVDRRKN